MGVTPGIESSRETPARSPDWPEVGQVIAEKYRIDEVLGEGGMGLVYRAQNLLTHKAVALKWMLPGAKSDERAVRRFLREARAAGRIDHPNVVDVYDVGRDGEGDVPFLVMELLRGEPASSIIGADPLPPRFAVDVLMPALRGIYAAHAKGIVHRDLKPENIFLCHGPDGEVEDAKVLDFGISKALYDDNELDGITQTGAVMGTPHYMSPEQIRGMKDVDVRTDVYALGVILFEALTGRTPWSSETFTALAVEIATSDPPSMRELNPTLDPELDAVVRKALARDPAKRFSDVAELGRALEPFGSSRFDDRRTSIPHPPPGSRERREDKETLAGGVVVEAAAFRSTPPAGQLAPAEVEGAGGGEPGEPERAADHVSDEEPPLLPRPSRAPLAMGVAALAVVLLGLGAWIMGREPDPPAEPVATEPPASTEVIEPSEPAAATEGREPEPDPLPVGLDVEAHEPEPAPAESDPGEAGPAAERAGVGAAPQIEPASSGEPTGRRRGEARRRRRARRGSAPSAGTSGETSAAHGSAAQPESGASGSRGFRTEGVSLDDF